MKPKFLLSKSKVLKQYNTVRKYCDIVSYSSKTNQDVTKILEQETDSMFSVHFERELRHIKDFSRVIFLAQAWDSVQIKRLYEKRVRFFIVDNEYDLDVFVEFLRTSEIYEKVSLLLRLKVKENTLRTERYFVFGMKGEVVNRRIREITSDASLMQKIEKLGIHFHRKTQNMSEWSLIYQIQSVIEEDVLDSISIINIGGGLPSEYANTNVDVMPGIFTKIEELKEWLETQMIILVVEPGRFIAAPAGELVTQIIGVYEGTVVVNASVYNSDMDAILVPVKLKIKSELAKGEGKAYVVKGITPCSMDLFRYRVYLDDPQVGNELVFINAGSYNFTTDFCDLEKIETEIVE